MQMNSHRFQQINDWIFETKTIKAIKTAQYGQPYSGIATLTLNGDDLYIDGQMMQNGKDFSRRDWHAFYQFCQQLEVQNAHYHKMRDGVRQSRVIQILDDLPAEATVLKMAK